MWPSLTETPKVIQALYAEKAPSLRDVYLRELRIINGEDVQCYVKIDTKELPQTMPSKWKERNVNTVQIELLMIKADILFLEFINEMTSGDLQIELAGDCKKVLMVSHGKSYFSVKAKWLKIQSVTGYLVE